MIDLKQFVKDMAERAIKTAAQTAIASIGTTALINNVDWAVVASTVGVSTLLSVLSSIASINFGESDSASLIKKDETK